MKRLLVYKPAAQRELAHMDRSDATRIIHALEAFAAALYILGEVQHAEKILGIYTWGPRFLELNKEPLEEYRQAQTSAEVIHIMNKYI